MPPNPKIIQKIWVYLLSIQANNRHTFGASEVLINAVPAHNPREED
jgi:hypothetical protein